jgi:hypothetical protein
MGLFMVVACIATGWSYFKLQRSRDILTVVRENCKKLSQAFQDGETRKLSYKVGHTVFLINYNLYM